MHEYNTKIPERETSLTCPDCGSRMILRETKKYQNKDGSNRRFYGCSNFPRCNSTHACHADGKPLGFPANKETREARKIAHELFDEIWQSGKMKRQKAYDELAMLLGKKEVHFSQMNKEECEEAIKFIEEEFY